MREENVGDDFPDWLTLLHVQLVLFAHLVSVIYEFVFVFQNVRNIFFSSCFLVSHINTLPVTMYEQWQGFLRVFVRLDTINYRISVTVVYNITTITLFTPVVNEVSDIRLITNKI